MTRIIMVALAALLAPLASGCSGGSGSASGSDAGTTGDTGMSNTGTGSVDTTTDETDIPTETGNTGTTDTTGDTGSDTDTSNGLPVGCEIISPTSGMASGYAGMNAIREGRLVWRSIDTENGDSVYNVHSYQLDDRTTERIWSFSYPDRVYRPVSYGNHIYYENLGESGVEWEGEIYGINLTNKQISRLTHNQHTEGYIYPGERYLAVNWWGEGEGGLPDEGLKLIDRETGEETIVDNRLFFVVRAFDGRRWNAFVRIDPSLQKFLERYDIDNPDNGYERVEPGPVEQTNIAFNDVTGELVASLMISGQTNGFDIFMYNMETLERTVLVEGEWDQGLVDAWGHVVAYADTAAAKKWWFGANRAEIKIVDRETRATRTVLPLDTYYGIGIWDHYVVANNVGRWGDTIVLCDLKVAGLVDDEGHVIPEADTDSVDGGEQGRS